MKVSPPYRLVAAVLLLSLVAASAFAAKKAAPKAAAGTVCLAAFHVTPASVLEPHVSETTWPPAMGSVFEFRIGKTTTKVAADAMVAIRDVPADRKMLVHVVLDGKPFESFWLDLRKEPQHRACFWLRRGYWQWINTGWYDENGCRCR